MYLLFFFFFFSSRRRHTRCSRDWSSDVCSSDIISFVLAGVACAFAGLCYAEFASLIPIAGSAYTYSYATLGELIAWIIGWDLILEYAFGAATVAVGWSGHLRAFLRDVGWNLPAIPTSSFTLFGLPVQ